MKTRRELRVGRDAINACWKAADELSRISQDVRYADKPADLTYPISELIQMTHHLRVYHQKWLVKWLDSRSERLDGWPKLHDRYL